MYVAEVARWMHASTSRRDCRAQTANTVDVAGLAPANTCCICNSVVQAALRTRVASKDDDAEVIPSHTGRASSVPFP
jgi:hypothetical protein